MLYNTLSYLRKKQIENEIVGGKILDVNNNANKEVQVCVQTFETSL